jgi:hypothetical protein
MQREILEAALVLPATAETNRMHSQSSLAGVLLGAGVLVADDLIASWPDLNEVGLRISTNLAISCSISRFSHAVCGERSEMIETLDEVRASAEFEIYCRAS